MSPTLIAGALGALALLAWIAVNLKMSRPDGDLVRDAHPYRRIMSFIMRQRNESIVYFETELHAGALMDYLQRARAQERFHCDMTHILVAACAVALARNPSMNRFVVGRRLYQRRGVWLTFSMKRRKMDKKSKIASVKLQAFEREDETFRELCARIQSFVEVERSDTETYMDRELNLFLLLPRFVLDLAVPLLQWCDRNNLLPASFIENDGMYTSIFLANLGSLGMGPAYHHLYEWGNCPLFLAAGRVEERPWVVDGAVVSAPVMTLRWSFDERVDDGLTARHGLDTVANILSDPDTWLGCLAEDGSEDRPLLTERA